MKKSNLGILMTLFTILSLPAVASELTVPNSFSAGTPAVAAEMNENFDAVKAAIDDNFNRITQEGTISVHANAFNVPDNQIGCADDNSNFLFMSAGSNCNAYAGVQLPAGARVTVLNCATLDDNSTNGAEIFVRLVRTSAADGASNDIFVTPSTVNSPATQRVIDALSIPGTDTINNGLYFYKLDASFGSANGGSSVRLYGCIIGFTYN